MSFFRTVTIAAKDATRSPDLLTRLRRDEIDGVLVRKSTIARPVWRHAPTSRTIAMA